MKTLFIDRSHLRSDKNLCLCATAGARSGVWYAGSENPLPPAGIRKNGGQGVRHCAGSGYRRGIDRVFPLRQDFRRELAIVAKARWAGRVRMGRVGLAVLAMSTWIVASGANASFVTFETGQVRPLAMSPDGTKLFAVNTPDDRLEIFN